MVVFGGVVRWWFALRVGLKSSTLAESGVCLSSVKIFKCWICFRSDQFVWSLNRWKTQIEKRSFEPIHRRSKTSWNQVKLVQIVIMHHLVISFAKDYNMITYGTLHTLLFSSLLRLTGNFESLQCYTSQLLNWNLLVFYSLLIKESLFLLSIKMAHF